MKKILSKISSIALAFLGIFHGCCFADAVVMDPVPSNRLIAPKPVNTVAINESVQKAEPFNFTPIIIGIIVAIIVAIAIIVLLSGKKNNEDKE